MTEQIKNKRLETIQPRVTGKAQVGGTPSNFDSFLGAVDAMTPMNTELMYQATGSSNAAAVLHGAFTGMSGAAGAYGYGPAAGAGMGGYGGYGALATYPGVMGVGSVGTYSGSPYKAWENPTMPTSPTSTSTPSAAGTVPTGELINQMNINSLRLLELQATIQTNSQNINTRSNILSADHRARMSMIEKFTARA